MEQDIKFIDFRVTKLKDWLNDHRECNVEQVIGEGYSGDGFRFAICRQCNEAHFVGKC